MAIVVCFLLSFCLCLIRTYAHGDHEFKSDKVFVQWKMEQSDSVVFDVQAKTLGWVGIGFSAVPNMAGADLVVGGVKNGQAYLYDRHATGNSFPPPDNEQNYELISGTENSTHTVLKFRRKLDTGDKDDWKFDDKPFYLLWALNPNDAADASNIPIHTDHAASPKPMTLLDNDESAKRTTMVRPSETATKTLTTGFEHHTSLDFNGKYQLFWKFDEETITFQYRAASKGWAALGFSPNGGMAGADIALIWMDQFGKCQISDRHATENSYPPEDAHQDYTLIDCAKNDTHFIATFSRKRVTCDHEDWPLHPEDTVRLIYASNDEVPQSKDSFSKHTIRGAKSAHLFDKKFGGDDGMPPEPGAQPIMLNVHNAQIDGDVDTMYWCEILKIPKSSKKTQIIKIESALEPQNVEIVHHIIAYVCAKDMSQFVGKGVHCYDKDGNFYPDYMNCKQHLLAGWAVGATSQTYPPDQGRSLYNDEGDVYVMMEMHYDNPQLKRKVDSSGIRIWTTEKLRPIESGFMVIGVPTGADEQVIPPGMDEFTNYGICNAQCTSSFPKDGVKITSGLLHTHLAGKKMRLIHIRNGKQLPNIMSDDYYDFNYQDSRQLSEPVSVLPGDELVIECVYTTKDRNKTVFSGEGTREEMCIAFVEYFPAAFRGFTCTSAYNKKQMFKDFGINFAQPKEGKWGEYVSMPNGQDKPLARYLVEDHKFDWTPEKIKKFQEEIRAVNYSVYCVRKASQAQAPGGNVTTQVDVFQQQGYPEIKEHLVIQDECAGKKDAATKSQGSTMNDHPNSQPLVERGGAGKNKFSMIFGPLIGVAMVFAMTF